MSEKIRMGFWFIIQMAAVAIMYVFGPKKKCDKPVPGETCSEPFE